MKLSDAEILDVIQKALSTDGPVSVTAQSSMDTVPNWDSLGHLSVLVALDKRFEGRASRITELASARSVREIFDILRTHGMM